jgi:hypothetical protein
MKIDITGSFVLPVKPRGSKNGQAMIEYVIMMVLLLSSVVVLSIFLYTYKQHSDRVVNLVSSEYP